MCKSKNKTLRSDFMDLNLDRDYIWECDYGVRKPLVPILKKLLREQDASSLQMVKIFSNNNPYQLEMFVALSYDNPQENQIKTMLNELGKLGIRYRPDITLRELINEYENKRFNGKTFRNEWDIEDMLNTEADDINQGELLLKSDLFAFAEKAELERRGYVIKPLGEKLPVFLSHSSKDKEVIEDLIPYLNGSNLPTWYDKINIDYGDSIDKRIEHGIKIAGAVLFSVSRDFLKSDWCKLEMDSFLKRLLRKEEILILSIILEEIPKEELPSTILKNKYFTLDEDRNLGKITKDIIPVLKRYYDEKMKVNLF